MVLGISEFDVEDTLDSMLNDIESKKVQEQPVVQEVPKIKEEINEPKLTISRFRLFFNRLTDEQVKLINETGELPENTKFVSCLCGGYKIVNNWFNFRSGTCILPFGYEVSKNLFGFTIVVPIGTKGFWIKKSR